MTEAVTGERPSAAERDSEAAALSSGSETLGRLVARLRAGTDSTANVDPTIRLFRALLGRDPDSSGFDFWLAHRRGGASLASMTSRFAASSEFTRLYGPLSNEAFVERVYRNVLGRAGESSGVAFWTGQLDQRRRSRGELLVGFSESRENRRVSGPAVEVDALYLLLLGRTPTKAELNGGVAALGRGTTVAQLADAIFATPEYATHLAAGA